VYGERLRETDGLEVTVDDARFADYLSDDVAGVVFSILEEAINNARKHAQAQSVVVTLQTQGDVLVATVRDNGMGFDVEAIEQTYDQRGSLGLLNMRERAELIDGNLAISSTPGQGTTITLIAPMESAKREGQAGAEGVS